MRNIRNSNRQTGRPEIYEICLITAFMTGAPDLLREYDLRRNCENASIGGQSIYACSSWSDWLFVLRHAPMTYWLFGIPWFLIVIFMTMLAEIHDHGKNYISEDVLEI
jgi:hypothetical protein